MRGESGVGEVRRQVPGGRGGPAGLRVSSYLLLMYLLVLPKGLVLGLGWVGPGWWLRGQAGRPTYLGVTLFSFLASI